jgi:hypothetical protein
MDNLCDIFEKPVSAFKRSPVARLDRLSFLDEITDEQFKTYSKDQLNQILKQRAKVSIFSSIHTLVSKQLTAQRSLTLLLIPSLQLAKALTPAIRTTHFPYRQQC